LAITAAEAARRTGLSAWSIYRAVNAGVLPVVAPALAGKRVLIPVAALEAAMADLTEFREPKAP
jgi:excisionase family DNA binding protein